MSSPSDFFLEEPMPPQIGTPRRPRATPVPCLLRASALLVLPGLLYAQDTAAPAEALPRVHVVATGGTISNTEGDRLTGEELVAGLPGVEEVARITVEQFSNVASGAITLEQWLELSRRIDGLFMEDPELAGVVITHGTDTMEETAYFLDLTLADCRPVIVTGSMRPASAPGTDGPANLLASIRVAASEGAGRLGSVVLMNDEIFPGREVTKIHTSRTHAFVAPAVGGLGVVDPDAVVLHRAPAHRMCGTPAFPVSHLEGLPRVDVVYTALGSDGALVRAAVEAGAKGIVMASVGRGGVTPGQGEAVDQALERGVVVVRSSRTGAGRVPVDRGSQEARPTLGAGDLNPQKARILLMLALTRTDDPDELREIFRRH